jgi:hypothetical protein
MLTGLLEKNGEEVGSSNVDWMKRKEWREGGKEKC